ncbi:MAG: AAA family ATPase [Gammaproteobacteria bacterium]|jgi:type II secretory pathway predicted ATPase ExeA
MLDVYKSCYNLKGQPFRLSPDYRFSFNHPSYDEARSYLKYAVAEGEGFVVITGAPGTGKTTLIGSLLAELDNARVRVASIANQKLDPRSLVERVNDAFDLPVDNDIAPLPKLMRFLNQNRQQGGRAILIVDEAQTLSREALEELRLLSNMQNHDGLLLQVFLLGQEQLLDIIHVPEMEQLQQRMIAASHLEPLQLEETIAYIEHRLRTVGWQNDPDFNEESLNLIHKFSAGVPRRINLICHRLFLRGGLENKHTFEGEDALHVIVELNKEGLLSPVKRKALG